MKGQAALRPSGVIISRDLVCNTPEQLLTNVIWQVEPQEKKKTPKGRAKKRITYTRRFVNVTLTGGKRKVSIQTTEQDSENATDHSNR